MPPTGHTAECFQQSQIPPTGQTAECLVSDTTYWSHSRVFSLRYHLLARPDSRVFTLRYHLLVTQQSVYSQTPPTGHTAECLVSDTTYWSDSRVFSLRYHLVVTQQSVCSSQIPPPGETAHG